MQTDEALLAAHRLLPAVRPGFQQATDPYWSMAQGLETPVVTHFFYYIIYSFSVSMVHCLSPHLQL